MPISRITINDHIGLGKKIAEWAKDENKRPKTIAEMRAAVAGMADIPARIKKLVYVQADMETMLMRLPNKDMLMESEEMFKPTGVGGVGPAYMIPTFYGDAMGKSSTRPPLLDTLYSRIADYTIAQCK